MTPLSAMSRVGQEKTAEAFSLSQQLGPVDVRDVVHGVGGAVHKFRHGDQQKGRLHFARVEAVGILPGIESFERPPHVPCSAKVRSPNSARRSRTITSTKREVAAVYVVEGPLFEPRTRYARAKVAQNGHERRGAHRKRAGKADVLVALAVAYRRQRVNGTLRWKFCQGAAEQQIVDERDRCERQIPGARR
jgi:hypothetical protein